MNFKLAVFTVFSVTHATCNLNKVKYWDVDRKRKSIMCDRKETEVRSKGDLGEANNTFSVGSTALSQHLG